MGGNAEDMRNHVAALVATKTPPTMGKYVEATFKADLAVQAEPSAPWGYEARCLVAMRIGDRDMLDRCVADLRRVAPDHEATLRTVVMAAHEEPTLAIFGRWLLVAALAGTLAHAAWNRRRKRGRAVASPLVGVSALLFLSVVARAAHGAPTADETSLSGIKIDPADPSAAIPPEEAQLKDPMKFGYLLQDLLAYAQGATKRGDLAGAARYYVALTKAVPTRAYPYGKLCEIEEKLGDRDQALAWCREALGREGVSAADFDRTVNLIVARPLEKADRVELEAISKHLGEMKDAPVGAQQVRCKVGLALHDVKTLEACTTALAAVAAADSTTLSYQWALAVERRDFSGAEALVARARQAGLAAEAVTQMEVTTKAERAVAPPRRVWALAAVAALALLALAAAPPWPAPAAASPPSAAAGDPLRVPTIRPAIVRTSSS